MGVACQTAHAEAPKPTQPPQITEAGFYPFGGAVELTVKAIDSAKESIFLAGDVTSGPVVQALANARKRGVNILVILDKSQEKARYSGAKLLVHEGIQVHIDRKHNAMNNNYMVIDGQTLEIGRFNYTETAAKKNADNVIVLWNNPAAAKPYRANWQEHWDHSTLYK